MTVTYTQETTQANQAMIVRTNEDGTQTFIPADPANSDYQTYLASLEA